MSDGIDQPEMWIPTAWPLFWRRVFFVTLPISGPLWVAAVVAYGLMMMVVFITLVLPWLLFCEAKEKFWDDQRKSPQGTGR